MIAVIESKDVCPSPSPSPSPSPRPGPGTTDEDDEILASRSFRANAARISKVDVIRFCGYFLRGEGVEEMLDLNEFGEDGVGDAGRVALVEEPCLIVVIGFVGLALTGATAVMWCDGDIVFARCSDDPVVTAAGCSTFISDDLADKGALATIDVFTGAGGSIIGLVDFADKGALVTIGCGAVVSCLILFHGSSVLGLTVSLPSFGLQYDSSNPGMTRPA